MRDYILALPSIALTLWMYMTGWFVLSIWKRRNDVADTAWGLGFVLVALTSLLSSSSSLNGRGVFVSTLVLLWGLRLAIHISHRNRGKAEDTRYVEMRKSWGSLFFFRSYMQVFLLQGALLLLVATPVLYINLLGKGGDRMTWIDALGTSIWITGFLFESIGDSQLTKFISNPMNKGKLMTTGLWRYTRHPNYFGEVTQWWGLFVIACSLPQGWITIIGPLTITGLILFVSGIPMLERKMMTHPDFPAYAKRTSVFLPWFPKNS